MRKFLLITLLIALGCSSPLEPTTGSLAVKLIFPEDDSHLSKKLLGAGDPVKVKIKVNPGNLEKFFDFDTHEGVIDELDPGTYNVDVFGLDSNNTVVLSGSEEGVQVRAGEPTPVRIELL